MKDLSRKLFFHDLITFLNILIEFCITVKHENRNQMIKLLIPE